MGKFGRTALGAAEQLEVIAHAYLNTTSFLTKKVENS
jgi:hypothetical protein